MEVKSRFSIQSFIVIVILNAIILVTFYLLLSPVFSEMNHWLSGLISDTEQVTPENLNSTLTKIKEFIAEKESRFLLLFGIGGFITILLWFGINAIARRLFLTNGEFQKSPKTSKDEKKEESKKAPEITEVSPAPAIQILSILQKQGRLIDFLQEDLSTYQDEQIGAAVRTIHEGCKKAIGDHMQLEPIFKEEEGSEVTVPSGFNANQIRLTGNVSGEPPFKGAVRHRGWRIVKIDLPKQVGEKKDDKVLEPAEVEIGG